MKTVAIIPARFNSSRFPGKPLAKILGKEMILWVAERVSQARWLSRVVVATDDERIARVVSDNKFAACLTDADHPSGTDRIYEAACKQLKLADQDIVVNIQGDEPLVEADWIKRLVAPVATGDGIEMSSLAHAITPEELRSTNNVKVLVNKKSQAIYFSRFPVPFSRLEPDSAEAWTGVYKHMGFYAYTMGFLREYCGSPPSFMETAESLEQLRALDLGARIAIEVIEGRSWGVDTPEDIAKIEPILGAQL